MANFKTHLSVAATVSAVVSGLGFFAKLYGVGTAIFAVMIGTIGGLLPDIDLRSSRPAKKGFYFASLFLATFFAVLYASNAKTQEGATYAMALWFVVFGVFRFGVFELFSRVTVHRGMVHSVPYMAIFGLLLVYATHYGLSVSAYTSWILGLFLFFGGLVHLILDEMYSVNIWNFKLKKSAGTAFKFFESDKPIQYALLYTLLGLLWVFAPSFYETWSILKQTSISFIN